MDRITQGALAFSRRSGDAAQSSGKPWQAAAPSEALKAPEAQTNAQGQRRERVRSALGEYCINTPNTATALRNPFGPTIVGPGNCP